MKRAGLIAAAFYFFSFNLLALEPIAVGYLREKFRSRGWKKTEPDLIILKTTKNFPTIWLRTEGSSYLPLHPTADTLFDHHLFGRRLVKKDKYFQLEHARLKSPSIRHRIPPNIMATTANKQISFELVQIEVGKEIFASKPSDIDLKELALVASMVIGSIIEPIHILTATSLDENHPPSTFKPSSLKGVRVALSRIKKNSKAAKSIPIANEDILSSIRNAIERIQWPRYYQPCNRAISGLTFESL